MRPWFPKPKMQSGGSGLKVEGATLPNNVDEVLDQIEAQQAIELAPNATSLTLLQAIYRNSALPLMTRMRAAIASIQFAHPKLQVTATIEAGDFADQLDRAVERSRRVLMIEEATTVKAIEEDKPTTDARLRPSVADRRYRRW
jgi:hypothetical protein